MKTNNLASPIGGQMRLNEALAVVQAYLLNLETDPGTRYRLLKRLKGIKEAIDAIETLRVAKDL